MFKVFTGAFGKRSNIDQKINRSFIYKKSHWLAVKAHYFKKIVCIDPAVEIFKRNGIPFIIDSDSNTEKPVSISHHVRFWEGITLRG